MEHLESSLTFRQSSDEELVKSTLEAWLTSVAHAANTGSEVVLCPGDADGCRNSIDWSRGWIAYADIDGDRQRGANPMRDRVRELGGTLSVDSPRDAGTRVRVRVPLVWREPILPLRAVGAVGVLERDPQAQVRA